MVNIGRKLFNFGLLLLLLGFLFLCLDPLLLQLFPGDSKHDSPLILIFWLSVPIALIGLLCLVSGTFVLAAARIKSAAGFQPQDSLRCFLGIFTLVVIVLILWFEMHA